MNMFIWISFIFIILLAINVRNVHFSKSIQKKMIGVYCAAVLLITLVCFIFILPKVPTGEGAFSKESRQPLYSYSDFNSIPAEYKVEEFDIESPRNNYEIQLKDVELDLGTWPEFYVKSEKGRDRITVIRYESPSHFAGFDISPLFPKTLLDVEGEKFIVSSEGTEKVVEHFYEITNDAVTNQFAKERFHDMDNFDFEAGDVYFQLIVPEGTKVTSKDELIYVEDLDELD